MRQHRSLATLGVGTLAVGLSTLCAAQTTTPTGALEEIVVTAQRRAENLQTVPLSITTFGGVALEQKQIASFFDYATKVPNLAFAMTGDGVGTARTVSIRGISGDNTTGFYIDDTPLPDSIDPRVLDIDHIEVLRGPQGTLYGARSMGGTVRIITKAPEMQNMGGDVHAEVSKTWNTNRPNYVGEGVVNVPVMPDVMALRLSVFYDTQAGFFQRRYCTDPATAGVNCFPLTTDPALTTTVDNVGELDTYGGAATLAIKASDNLTITPRWQTQRADYNGFPMSDYLYNPTQFPQTGYPYPAFAFPTPRIPPITPNNFVQGRFFNIPEGGHDAWDLFSLGIHYHTNVGELVSSTAYFSRVVQETEDETDFIWASLLPLASLPIGPPFVPPRPLAGPIASAITEVKNYQRFVQEIRFVSSLQGPVNYVVGFFYSDFHGRIPFAAYYPPAIAPGFGAVLMSGYNGLGSCAVIGFCWNPNNPDEIFGSDYKTDIKDSAPYGELTWQFIEPLKATFGLRYNHVQTTAGGYIEGAVTQPPPPAPGRIVDQNVTTTENAWTPKLQLDYKINQDAMVYATGSKGFRPGGLVPSVPATLCAPQLPNGVTPADTRQFHSDSLWNYELGAKTTWANGRVTLNIDGFYIDWKDIQQWILLACGFQYRANAGAATVKGGEMELNARPIDPLEFNLGIGYQDAKITETSKSSPQRVGDPVFQVPDWTINGGFTWTQPITTDWSFVGGADYSYIGKSYSSANLINFNGVFATRERPSYEILNLRAGITHYQWQVAIVGRNLTNEHANLGDSRSIAAETSGRPRILTNQPRTIGVEFRSHF
jgi:outer membrane receptor protein involved in Fe transport